MTKINIERGFHKLGNRIPVGSIFTQMLNIQLLNTQVFHF